MGEGTVSAAKALLAGRERDLLARLGITQAKRGQHIRCPTPSHEDRNPSWRWDEDKRRYFCSCGNGDILDLIIAMGRASDAKGAAQWACDALGLEMPATERKPGGPRRDPSQDIERWLTECDRLAGTVGETYLASRGLAVPDSPDLKFHGDLRWRNDGYRALVAVIRDRDGNPTGGIHRTFLLADGSGKAAPGKKMLGPCRGGCVRLAAIGEDGRLGIAEGIETALSASQIFGIPVWAGLSDSGVRSFRPPAGVRHVVIFADNGEPGERAAQDCAARLRSIGIEYEIRTPLHGDDFNDDLQRGATIADYAERSNDTKQEIITPRDSDIIVPIRRAARPACYDTLIMSNAEIPRPLDLMANGSLILRMERAFQGRLRYDEHRSAIVCRDLPWDCGSNWGEWRDEDDCRFAEWAQLREVPLRPGTCAHAVSAVADDNRFHPIADYLDSLHWDGVPRLIHGFRLILGLMIRPIPALWGDAG